MDQLVEEPDSDDGVFTEEHLEGLDVAVRAFCAAGPELLGQATEHLWAYYLDTAEESTPEERAEYGIPKLGEDADIWTQVAITLHPALVPGGTATAPAQTYISFEVEVSWEREPGLQLVVADGVRIGNVGPYDGHVTHAAASADLSCSGSYTGEPLS